MPEFDREGRSVCLFWLQGVKPQRDSHRKNRVLYGSGEGASTGPSTIPSTPSGVYLLRSSKDVAIARTS